LTYKKQSVQTDVLTLARERVRTLYDRFDRVAVSFSGGKDSTVALHVTLDEARLRGRLPLEVVFWDEEAIQPETIEYVARVRALADVALRWLCVPVKHRNACSRKHPYWHPWAPEDRAKWCRPLPPGATTELAGFDRQAIPVCNALVFPPSGGQVALVMGIRAAESLRRYRSVAKRVTDNWLAQDTHAKHVVLAKPVYDWTTEDVWTAPRALGWDYNRAYDVMTAAGISRHAQRVCPPYGEEPLRGLWQYAQCWPELWEKMVQRVPGAATAGRYCQSPVYAHGERAESPPEGMTWQQAIAAALQKWPAQQRGAIAARIKQEMGAHVTRNGKGVPIPDAADVGLSWQFLYMVAVRGDLKVRKSVQVAGDGGTRFEGT